jgi:hypothetical protein
VVGGNQLMIASVPAGCGQQTAVTGRDARNIRPAVGGKIRVLVGDPDCIRLEQLERRLLCQQHAAENDASLGWKHLQMRWPDASNSSTFSKCKRNSYTGAN